MPVSDVQLAGPWMKSQMTFSELNQRKSLRATRIA